MSELNERVKFFSDVGEAAHSIQLPASAPGKSADNGKSAQASASCVRDEVGFCWLWIFLLQTFGEQINRQEFSLSQCISNSKYNKFCKNNNVK